jgi:hypothetical protein
MNDDKLLTAVRESFDDVRSATALERIVSRSRAVRARRRIPAVTGVLALAAGAAVAVAALSPAGPASPGSHQPSHPAHAQLAAWTVTKQADGTILVKIREFRDRAGLQRKLRADGVPANIIFVESGNIPANPDRIHGNPCRQFNGDGNDRNSRRLERVAHLVDPKAPDPFQGGVVINPSALPRHVGLQFYITRNLGYSSPQQRGGMAFLEDLVVATPQCTGS